MIFTCSIHFYINVSKHKSLYLNKVYRINSFKKKWFFWQWPIVKLHTLMWNCEGNQIKHGILQVNKKKGGKWKNLNFGIVGSYENFFLAVTVEIGDKGRRKAFSFVFDWVFIGKVHPCVFERNTTILLNWIEIDDEINKQIEIGWFWLIRVLGF